jgi:RNA polymerase sigma-70 factor (ECF subfamily)
MTPADKPTSLTLLERVRGRDEEAWRRLLHLYGPLVDRWCGHQGVRGDDLEDVRQEVFRAVLTGLEGFRRDRPGDTFRGWLRVVTRRRVLDHFRLRQDRPAAQGGTDARRLLEQAASQDLPDDTDEDLRELYRRALDLVRGEFEPQTWSAFWRCVIEGQSPAEIAADLGVTPAAVRKAKSRVLFRLRQEIGDLIG